MQASQMYEQTFKSYNLYLMIQFDNKKYGLDVNSDKITKKTKINFDSKFMEYAIQQIGADKNHADYVFVEIDEAKNKHLIFKRIIGPAQFV